jgi:hypothetical protein
MASPWKCNSALRLSREQTGTLAAVCDELAKHKVNIFALTISDTVDHAVVRLGRE